MTDKLKRLAKLQLANTPAAVYTVPATAEAVVRHIRIANPDTVQHTATLYDSGTGTADIIEPTITLQPGDGVDIDCFICLEEGQYIAAVADAPNKVNLMMYGLETLP